MTEIHALVWVHPSRRIFGTDEARNFKFGVRIDLGKSHLMSDKSTLQRSVVRVQGRIFKPLT